MGCSSVLHPSPCCGHTSAALPAGAGWGGVGALAVWLQALAPQLTVGDYAAQQCPRGSPAQCLVLLLRDRLIKLTRLLVAPLRPRLCRLAGIGAQHLGTRVLGAVRLHTHKARPPPLSTSNTMQPAQLLVCTACACPQPSLPWSVKQALVQEPCLHDGAVEVGAALGVVGEGHLHQVVQQLRGKGGTGGDGGPTQQ